MAHVTVQRDEFSFDDPVMVEGLPGLGLVGKIAADHLVEALEMPVYATCHCEGLPEVAVYDSDGSGVQPPVRIHADPDSDLLVLQSDVPISPSNAQSFAGCVTGWLEQEGILPMYVSGRERATEGQTDLYGLATGEAATHLTEHDIPNPDERGVVSGPTGALLYRAQYTDLDALCIVVEASRQFPDPAAAKTLLEEVVTPLTGVDVETETLVEQAQDISAARERLAKRMGEADDESSRAEPLRMFQ